MYAVILNTTMIEKGDHFVESENSHHYENDPINHYKVVELSYITIDEMVLQNVLGVVALTELNNNRVTAGLPTLTDIPTLLVKDILHRMILIDHRYRDLLDTEFEFGNYLKFKESVLQRYSTFDEPFIFNDYSPTILTIDRFEEAFQAQVSGVN